MFLSKEQINSAIESTKKAANSEEATATLEAGRSAYSSLLANKAVRSIIAGTGFGYLVGLFILPSFISPSLCATLGCLLAIHGLITK